MRGERDKLRRDLRGRAAAMGEGGSRHDQAHPTGGVPGGASGHPAISAELQALVAAESGIVQEAAALKLQASSIARAAA